MNRECYIASLKLLFPLLSTNNIKNAQSSDMAMGAEDLDS